MCVRPAASVGASLSVPKDDAMTEAHQVSEVQENMNALRACAAEVAATMRGSVKCAKAPEGCASPPAGSKLCHFIRHGMRSEDG